MSLLQYQSLFRSYSWVEEMNINAHIHTVMDTTGLRICVLVPPPVADPPAPTVATSRYTRTRRPPDRYL